MSAPVIATQSEDFEGFSQELRSYWNRLPNKTFFFVLLLAWLALYHFFGNSTFGYMKTTSLFDWMYGAYYGMTPPSDDSHGGLVPFVVLGLCWWKRRELMVAVAGPWWPGLIIVGFALLLHMVGYFIQQPRVSIVAMFVGMYGLMGLTWGKAWLRASFFPFLLFMFCIPMASLAEPLTFRLRLIVSMIVEFITHDLLPMGVMREGTRLFQPPTPGNPGFDYEVAAACGGIRSLIAISGLAVVYAFVAFKSNWKRAVLILMAAPLAVLGNTFRLLVIIIAAKLGGKEWGMWVHDDSTLSMLPYVPAFFGLMYIGNLLEGAPEKTGDSSSTNDPIQQPTI